jgi:hypothetical protein
MVRLAVPPASVTVPIRIGPRKNVTVPLGLAPVTLAVSVSGVPTWDVVVERESAVVVAGFGATTVTGDAADETALKFASPAYVAVKLRDPAAIPVTAHVASPFEIVAVPSAVAPS